MFTMAILLITITTSGVGIQTISICTSEGVYISSLLTFSYVYVETDCVPVSLLPDEKA